MTAAEAIISVPLQLTAARDAKPGVRIVAFDTTVDGRRYGEWFDGVVGIRPESPNALPAK
jgi:hypothetical protein